MAKKKSKDFIIPSVNFLTTIPTEESPQVKLKQTPVTPPVTVQEAAEKLAHQQSISKKHNPEPKELIKKPAPLKISQQERRKSALSLSSLKRQKEEDARFKKKKSPTENTADLPKDPFTQEQFDQVWNAYIAELHGGGEKILASILKADAPKIRNNQIHVVYPNEMMKVELLKVRPKVLRQLKEN